MRTRTLRAFSPFPLLYFGFKIRLKLYGGVLYPNAENGLFIDSSYKVGLPPCYLLHGYTVAFLKCTDCLPYKTYGGKYTIKYKVLKKVLCEP